MMISVRFACGHSQFVDGLIPPCCSQCQNTRVVHVVAPRPRFSGLASGPCSIGGTVNPIEIPVVIPKEPSHGR